MADTHRVTSPARRPGLLQDRRGSGPRVALFLMLSLSCCIALIPRAHSDKAPSLFAVQMHSLSGSPAVHRRALHWVVEMGAGQVRDELFWHLVEQEKGVYKIPSRCLENIRATSNAGLQTILILDYANPLYDEGLPPTSEEAAEAFAGYCAHMARQLKGQVSAFEIWNEPNTDGFWKPSKDPAAYANLLQHAYRAIKKADPDATVLGCSLAGLDVEFFDGVADRGGLEFMDAVSVHTYCFPGSPEEKGKFEEVRRFHQHVEKRAGRPVPIWITEMGWPTQTGGGLSELRQAELLGRTYLLAAAHPEIVTLCWYWLGPDGPDEYWAEDRYSLTHPDGSPKPGRVAYRTLARVMGSAAFDKPLVDLGPFFKALIFNKEDGPFLAVWSSNDQGHDIDFPGELVQAIETLNGRRTAVPQDIHNLWVHVDGEPLLLHCRPSERFPIRLAPPRFDYQPRAISSGALWREPQEPTTTFQFLPRWNETLDIVRRGEAVEFVVAPGNPLGPARADLLLSATQDDSGLFALLAMGFTITEPVQIILQPVIQDALNALQVQLQPADPERGIRFQLSVLSVELGLNICHRDLALDGTGACWTIPVPASIPSNQVAEVTATVTLAGGEQVVQSKAVSFLRIPRVKTAMTVDGDLSEWDDESAGRVELGRRDQYSFADMEWNGPDDASARVLMAWEPEWLYLAAWVQDDVFGDTATGAELYQNDGFELYFDTDPEGDPLDTTHSSDDHQWGVCASEGRAVVYRWSQRTGESKLGRAVIRHTTGGYLLEARIPASELVPESGEGAFQGRFEPGLHFGFTIALNDDDSPGTTHPFHQDLQLQWSRRRNAFLNPEAFADLFFVE